MKDRSIERGREREREREIERERERERPILGKHQFKKVKTALGRKQSTPIKTK